MPNLQPRPSASLEGLGMRLSLTVDYDRCSYKPSSGYYNQHAMPCAMLPHQRLKEVKQRGESIAEGGVLVQQHLYELYGQLWGVEPTGELFQEADFHL